MEFGFIESIDKIEGRISQEGDALEEGEPSPWVLVTIQQKNNWISYNLIRENIEILGTK